MSTRLCAAALLCFTVNLLFVEKISAFGRHGRSSCCCTSYYTPCSPCPPCQTDCCCLYTVSGDPVPIGGPFPTLLRSVHVCGGVIVQIDVPFGAPPFPTDQIVVINTAGAGHMHYTGYNKKAVHPGLPGSPTRYSIFLCPEKLGKCTVQVTLFFSDGTSKMVPFEFEIK